jgi:hypothetical protein
LGNLPAEIPEQAKEIASVSIIGTVSVLGQAAESGIPASTVAQLQSGAFEAFLNASHITSMISTVVIMIAFFVVVFGLPKIDPPQKMKIEAPMQVPDPAKSDTNAVIEAEFSNYDAEVAEELGSDAKPVDPVR